MVCTHLRPLLDEEDQAPQRVHGSRCSSGDRRPRNRQENRRLSLGHKQLEENPWNAFEADYRVGTIHEGTIREFVEKGAVISLPEGIEAFATPKHLVKADGTQAVKGETLPFKVIEFNKDSRRIIVSHSRTFEDEAKAELVQASVQSALSVRLATRSCRCRRCYQRCYGEGYPR